MRDCFLQANYLSPSAASGFLLLKPPCFSGWDLPLDLCSILHVVHSPITVLREVSLYFHLSIPEKICYAPTRCAGMVSGQCFTATASGIENQLQTSAEL